MKSSRKGRRLTMQQQLRQLEQGVWQWQKRRWRSGGGNSVYSVYSVCTVCTVCSGCSGRFSDLVVLNDGRAIFEAAWVDSDGAQHEEAVVPKDRRGELKGEPVLLDLERRGRRRKRRRKKRWE